MKKIISLSALLSLGLISTATSVSAETQMQAIASLTAQSITSESIGSDSATIRKINNQLNSSKAVAQNVTSVSQLSERCPSY